MYFPYQVANLLFNEFITSKTFLLDFVNSKMFVNKQLETFVDSLTCMAGKCDVMIWGLLLCDVTAISRQRCVILVAATCMWNHSKKAVWTLTLIMHLLFYEKSLKIKTCISNNFTVKSSVTDRKSSRKINSNEFIVRHLGFNYMPNTEFDAQYGYFYGVKWPWSI